MATTDPGGSPALERWWEEHSELDRLVRDLESALEQARADRAGDASTEIIEALRAHLSVEEEVYLPLVERLLPDEAPEIERIRQGHAQLLSGLDRITGAIAGSDLEGALDSFRKLMGHFRMHEEAENRIVERLRSVS